ncbi:hypothetical protein TL16_g09107 [Triparma laevis f. inornata]|uniref:Uncharacterized protein n=1 Tax=Triparma laevis f. inornata TaxID=1714386 RepID=A0A9W7B7W8_9STRA|nr:hypothetical protein TL16_g09107 [Triparma laevis f. inornata]
MILSNGASTPPPGAGPASLSVRHNTREHTSLSGNSFLGGGAFGSQSPAAGGGGYSGGGDFSSFLEGVMTEEERRTRTRQLPDVEGFASLSKSESKSDIAIARSFDHTITTHAQLQTPSYEDMEHKLNNHLNVSHIVESVSSFNPPRPPESSGANKKRRMTRWEKNPSEIDQDLANYRRTVQKTREELTLANTERSKVEHIASTIRTHFLHHLRASQMESTAVTNETEKILTNLTDTNDRLNKKKKLGSSMPSTLALLTSLAKLPRKKTSKKSANNPPTPSPGGIGGISLKAEEESTSIFGTKEIPSTLSAAWIVPGDSVSTPFGVGFCIKILLGESIKSKSLSTTKEDVKTTLSLLPPRLAIELPYGIAYMLPGECSSLVNLVELSDEELVTRWMGMLKSAEASGSYVDTEAMSGWTSAQGYNVPSGDAALYNPTPTQPKIDVDGDTAGTTRFVRFGDAMIPTPGGRGGSLSNVRLQQLRSAIGSAVTSRQTADSGFAASDPALVLPDGFREWEEERLDVYKLRGHLMQLKKIVRRQEIAKNLTEKAYTATVVHKQKQAETCKEAIDELDELKTKCSAELKELGISEEKAKAVLAKKLENNAPSRDPPKKPKKKAKATATSNMAPNRSSKRKRGGGRGKTKKAKEAEELEDLDEDEQEEAPKRNARRGEGDEDVKEEDLKEERGAEESVVAMDVDEGGDSQDEAPAKKKGGRKPRGGPRR